MKRPKTTAPRGLSPTIIGEGLVGSVLALMLAKRGVPVEVYERRPDMRREKTDAGRSINLALSARGLHALKELGLETLVLKRAVPMMGRMIHPVRGPLRFQPYGKDDSEHINSISRAWLNETLMDKAEATKMVRINFNQRVLGIDFETMTIRVRDETTRRVRKAPVDLVLAADGSGSAIRESMEGLGHFTCSEKRLEHGYKELTLPTGRDGSFLLEKNALHIWPRGSYMLIALPNFEGSFTCTLFLPFEGPSSFSALGGADRAKAFFEKQFPDAAALIPDFVDQFLANPTGNMATVKCGPWNHGEKAVLLGDAAHAMVPFYGQGMNCGFEDCTVLGTILDRNPGPGGWRRALAEFARARKPDADAIAEMAVENFIEMRDKVGDPRFLLQKKVEALLQAAFPADYVPRYSLVTFSRTPYSLARRAGGIQERILAELCRGIADPGEVDLKKANTLIARELGPLLRKAKTR